MTGQKKRVAVVHDSLLEDGGAEKVLETIFEMYPGADLYTLNLNKSTNVFDLLKHRLVARSYNNWPYNSRFFVNLKKFFSFSIWESLNLRQYDLVISSSHSFSSKAVITNHNTYHLSYCHTPPKYLYAELSESNHKENLIWNLPLSLLRIQDYISAQRPNLIVANSYEVQKRILKYYGRKSVVVYPPVQFRKVNKTVRNSNEEYFVMVNRLTKVKGIDLAIAAFNKMKKKLLIIGDGKEKRRLMHMSGPNIEFLGYLSDTSRERVVSRAKAFIATSVDEDFGIAPVEAMGHGVPVVAYYSGAFKETVVNKKSGIFFRNYCSEDLIKKVIEFESLKFSRKYCINHAKKFSKSKFMNSMKKLIDSKINL